MKKLVFIIMIAVMAGCTEYQDGRAARSGNEIIETSCIDGVEYIHYSKGYRGYLAPHFRKDGSLYLCE